MNTEIKKIDHDFHHNGLTSEVVTKINEIIEAINRINKVLSNFNVKEDK